MILRVTMERNGKVTGSATFIYFPVVFMFSPLINASMVPSLQAN